MTTTSAPHESQHPGGRPDDGVAAARTEELYARYGRTVKGLCRALLRDRAEAEDAAQQTFLSAHRALLNGGKPLEPAAWLATIARNECWARIRTRMREPLPVDELETVSLEPDPLAEAIRRADLAALWAAIEALPRQQRDALLLREFGGLSYGELAEALAVSGPAVESLLFRARHRLRVQLSTAYASVSGASWIDALVRLFAGGGAPVAAKVAALGVGAAAVGSGAVVVPHVLDNHTHTRPAHTTPAPVKPKRVDAPATPILAERVVPTAARIVRRRPAVAQADASGSVREHDGERHGSGDQGETQVQANERHDREETEHTTREQRDSEHSGRGRDGAGDDRHGGSPPAAAEPEHSGDGSDSGDEEPVVTVPTPEVPPVPLPPLSGEG